MNVLKHKKYLNPKGLLMGAGVAWGIASMSAVSAGTIAQVPLFITTILAPNIMFILDDSGSMEWSYLPDSVGGVGGGIDLKSTKRGKSATINTVYYDPTITYTPPVYSDGTSLNATNTTTFTKAWQNGYASLPAHGGTWVNLSTAFQPTWNNETDYADTARPAYYYQFSPPQTNCSGGSTGDINDDDCYVKVVVSASSGPGSTDERQNFANWYSYYRTRLMTAKAGISRAFAQIGTTPRVGYGRINDSTSDTIDGVSINTVQRGVRTFSGSDRTAFFTWLFARTAANSTPLRRALNTAGFYYTSQRSDGPWSSTPGVSGGALLSCRQSYTVLMTDGYWNGDGAGTSGAQNNNDGSTTNSMTITDPSNTTSFSYTPVDPFKDAFSNTLADVAMYYWKRDLCASIDNRVPTSTLDPAFWQHVVTYGIGLGMPTSIVPDTAFSAISTNSPIAWPNPGTNTGVARIDDLLHAAVNSRGGFFNVKNPDEFTTSLTATLDKIVNAEPSSASAVAANSTRLNTGTQVFQAKFDPKDWSSKLFAYDVNVTTGALTSGWEASALLPAHGSRNIYTYNPSLAAGSRGVLFQWANLTTTPVGTSQQDYLNKLASVNDGKGALRVDWLRGNNANEKTTSNPGGFRNRTNFLGDIVNSDPVYVGSEDFGYATLPSPELTSYSTFRASSAYTSRRPMLYVGANDGMLHGFNAKSTGTAPAPGQEIFAYVPNALFPELSKLTSPTYSHQYYVDGMSAVSDVYYASAWHTLLAGTTGAGARAVFALDVTNPDAFGASSALWEFTDTAPPVVTNCSAWNTTSPSFTSANYDANDLGYTLAQPSVVRMQDGHWAVIVANGYNSVNGHAVLFVLDAQTGCIIKKIDTGAGTTGSKNGLSSPIAVDTNNDRSVDTVYAGDLYGNLWKFDVSGSASSWNIPGNSPLFVACTTTGATCSATNRQPITGKPNVGKVGGAGTDQNNVGIMVYFGTGKYFETGDNTGGSSQVQTFYGLWDGGSPITDRSLLQEQTIDFEGFAITVNGATSAKPIRVVSKNSVCYAATSVGCTSSSPLKSGWALNLLKPVNIVEGERVVSFPLVRRGLVVFSTVIPNADPCSFGGKSRLMEVDALGGGEFGGAAFDVNGNGVVNDNDDFVMIAGVKHQASGIDVGIGITKTPAVVESTSVDYKYLSGSTGQIGTVVDQGGGGGGGGGGSICCIRRSWRQLK